MAFQLRVKPGSYEVIPETVGARRKGVRLDPRFSNEEMEWATDWKGSFLLVGLLVKLENLGKEPSPQKRKEIAEAVTALPQGWSLNTKLYSDTNKYLYISWCIM